MAFKGRPTTDDTRYSCATTVAEVIEPIVKELLWVDFAVKTPPSNFRAGCRFMSDQQIPQDVDAIIVMNNHPDNTRLKMREWIADSSPKLFFDGWLQFKFLNEDKYSRDPMRPWGRSGLLHSIYGSNPITGWSGSDLMGFRGQTAFDQC